jgi:UDP-GlcNAc:undecaprenyl-phosphate/decaprenyl-phosphate GlcNAc-1-phosphate transferase
MLLIFIFGLITSLVISRLVISFYNNKNWLDDPKNETHVKKTHTTPVPRGGGIPIFISFLLGAVIFLQIDKYLIAIILAALLLAIIGVLDDIFDIHPYYRLLAGLLAGLIVVGAGLGIVFVSNPFGPGVIHLNQPALNFELFNKTRSIWIIADLFALVFIVWNMNIVNWSKGVDGQLPAFALVAFIFIGLLSGNFSADPTEFNNALMSFLLAGSFAGLLIFNWYPQKMMPGYGGGSLAGFFISVLAILSGAKVATSLMVLAVPTADAIYTIFRRIINKKSPIWGDRGHLHHQLLDVFKWGRRKVAIFYAATSTVMGLLALTLNTQGKIVALLLCFCLVFMIHFWAKIKKAYIRLFTK